MNDLLMALTWLIHNGNFIRYNTQKIYVVGQRSMTAHNIDCGEIVINTPV